MALQVNPQFYTYFTNLHRQTRRFFIHFILKDFFHLHFLKVVYASKAIRINDHKVI